MSEQAQARAVAGGMSIVLALQVFAIVAGLLSFAGRVFGSAALGRVADGRARLQTSASQEPLSFAASARSLPTASSLDLERSHNREPAASRDPKIPVRPSAPDESPTEPAVDTTVDIDAGPIRGRVSVSLGDSSDPISQVTVQAPGAEVTVTVGYEPVPDPVATVIATPVATVKDALDCPLAC